MNWAHLHLVLTHIPVVGIGFGIVLLAVAMVKRSQELQQVSFGILVLTALLTLPVYFTGEPAEELVEPLPGISEATIDRHEEAAETALVAVAILGTIAAAGLVLCRRVTSLPQIFSLTVLLLALGAGGTMAWTANLGGQIRHTEIHTAPKAAHGEPEKGDKSDWNTSETKQHTERDEADDRN
jgi:hypothetical protein